MTVTKITTHNLDALSRLMEQFKDKTNLIKILEIYLPLIQELEDTIYLLFDALSLNSQTGKYLDYIGSIIGLDRESGTTDSRYRQLIKVKIGTNISEGTPEQAISAFKLLTESVWVLFIDLFRGNISITGTTSYTDREEINRIFDAIDKVLAAGVRMPYFICADENESFAFAGSGAEALGFDDGSGSVGGKFAEVYTKELEFAFDGDDVAGGFGAGTDDPFVGGIFI